MANSSPRVVGPEYRMPAEWETHEATWLAWPHHPTDWPGKLNSVRWVYAEICRKLATREKLRILNGQPGGETSARRFLIAAGVDLSQVEFFDIPTNRGWTRDCGPLFVHDGTGRPIVAGFRFNGWSRYPDFSEDRLVPERAASLLGAQRFVPEVRGQAVVLEGGSIDVNGLGAMLTTEECLLDTAVQPRNPGLSRQDIEEVARQSLGVNRVIWLGRGIAGDDTHGHVDDICRFVNPSTVVLAQESHSGDPNYKPLQENRERLEGARLQDGSHIDTIHLPMPQPLWFGGERLPASYANFYIANGVVLVPTFNDPADRLALGILSDLFPDRTVGGIHAVDLVLGLGTIHCLTQQQPARRRREIPGILVDESS